MEAPVSPRAGRAGRAPRRGSERARDSLRQVAVTLLWVLGFAAVLVASLYVAAFVLFMVVS